MIRRSRLATRPRIEVLDDRLVLSALTPAQLDSAYGLNAVSFKVGGTVVKGDGTGQTIAIIDVEHDANLASELAVFDRTYGLSTAQLSVVDQAGNQSDPGWSEEEALDVEYAHAAAPAAKILVVEAASASTNDLINAIQVARNTAGVDVVSMSWGGSEFRNEASYDSVFTTPAGHVGITFLAASGDSGAGAEWPASSPNVVAVGGTTLSVSTSGTRTAESAWSGSGGGVSRYEAEPTYQKGVNSTGRRETPDVSLDANPNSGVSVYSAAGGGWIQVGGTSLATPVWAGLVAIADQGRAYVGKGSLDGATQTLPDLYAASTTSFNDVTTGQRATVGYDTSTGLGTPKAATLVTNLVADPAAGGASVTTASVGSGTTTTTPTTGTTTTTTGTTPTNPPARYWGGWWGSSGGFGGYGGGFGFYTAGSGEGWAGQSTPRNAGQSAPSQSTPIVPIRFSRPSALASTKAPINHGATDEVLDTWGLPMH